MTPQFAAVVDPIINRCLELIDRIDLGDNINARQEQARLRQLINEGDLQFGSSEAWAKAKYAVVCWIDETMIKLHWESSVWWSDHSLGFKELGAGNRNVEFFVQARAAAEITNKDALEVFYLCVALGFRGIYGQSNAAQVTGESQLPLELETWLMQTSKLLPKPERPVICGTTEPGNGAQPRSGRPEIFLMSVVAIVLVTATLSYFCFCLVNGFRAG